MIEETGKVVAVEDGAVWVETIRQSACHSCSAKSGCGHSALSKLGRQAVHLKAGTSQRYAVGDEVVIGVPEHVVVTSSLLAYLMPLVLALVFAIPVDAYTGSDGYTALAGLVGLALGFVGLRIHFRRNQHDERYQPQVLRRAHLADFANRDFS
jgi:sigma-E factor negative regulatory protein RseC